MLKNKIEIMIVSPEMHYNLPPPKKKNKKQKHWHCLEIVDKSRALSFALLCHSVVKYFYR